MNSGPMPQGKQIQQKQRHKHNIQTAVITQFKSPTLNSVCDIYRNRNITTTTTTTTTTTSIVNIVIFTGTNLLLFLYN